MTDKNDKKHANTEDTEKSTESTEEVKKDSVGSVDNSESSVIQELENQNKRVLADYRNLENRVQSERREWILKANRQLLLKLLPILDTLVMADKHSKAEDQNLKISISQFLDILKNEGVVRIETKEKDFDPHKMEVIQTVSGEENKVIEELRSGFMLGDQVLRVAQVTVGKKGDAETSSA